MPVATRRDPRCEEGLQRRRQAPRRAQGEGGGARRERIRRVGQGAEERRTASFAPVLEELVALRKEMAAACADPGVSAYDYLLDKFERGMTEERLTEIFGELRTKLVPVIAKILAAKPLAHPPALESGTFAEDAQEAFCKHVSASMGFDFGTGRLDRSVHPFTGGAGPHDGGSPPGTTSRCSWTRSWEPCTRSGTRCTSRD